MPGVPAVVAEAFIAQIRTHLNEPIGFTGHIHWGGSFGAALTRRVGSRAISESPGAPGAASNGSAAAHSSRSHTNRSHC